MIKLPKLKLVNSQSIEDNIGVYKDTIGFSE